MTFPLTFINFRATKVAIVIDNNANSAYFFNTVTFEFTPCAS